MATHSSGVVGKKVKEKKLELDSQSKYKSFKDWNKNQHQSVTFPIFEKEMALVNMKIYRWSGYEKHGLIFIAPP